MPSLQFHCRHRYRDGFALDVKFEAGDGVTALFGPSGSGKSTVLGLIAGLIRPDFGRIALAGRTLVDTDAGVWVKPEDRRIGLVFQDHQLFPHLNVRANLDYGRRRRPAREIDPKRVVEILELGPFLDQMPATLSGGQRQRVSLGRALLRGPELLLMDEPLAALDERLKERILDYLDRAVAEWRIPTIFVSHDQADVRRLAGMAVVIEAGKVIDSGPTAATLDRAAMTGLTARPGPINLLRLTDLARAGDHWQGALAGQALHLPGEGLPGSAAAGGTVTVQFLPSDVILARADVAGVSVRNQIHGTVREVAELPGRAFVAVDVGQFLWAEVTPAAVRELTLSPGTAVTCLIKTSAVRVVG